ncbi:MAG TPA: chemotaxis protein CheW [Baekduia sp.]|nr:chemotaxis protein CheW [Baekduia sp.]
MSSVHVSVRAGGEHYALPVEDVLEVAEIGHVTPVPGAGPAVLGVRNLRGQVIPVIDLTVLLGVRAQRPPEQILVAEESGRCAGLAVDSVTDVGMVDEPTEAADSRYLRGATFVEGALVGIVDLHATLDALVEGGTT